MKIVFTIHAIYNTSGGAERVISELASAMYERGHNVSLVITQPGVPDSENPSYDIHPGVKIYNIYPPAGDLERDENWDSTGATDRPLFRVRVRRRIKFFLWFFIRGRLREPTERLFDRISTALTPQKKKWHRQHDNKISLLKEALARIHPDLVVSFMPSSFAYTAEALKDSGIPLVVANRANPFHVYSKKRYANNPYYLKMIHRAFDMCAANLVQTGHFVDFFAPEVRQKTLVLPNPVKPAHAEFIASPESEEGIKTILSVGRLAPVKNHGLLIRAFSRVADSHPDWQVRIFGRGGRKEYLQQLINELNLGERVFLLGITKEIYREYAESQIFAFPSMNEGFSNALTEAMSHGLPSVIIEDCISNRDLVDECTCGYVARNDPEDFAEKLGLLMDNPVIRKEMAERAKSHVRLYEPAKVYDMWELMMRNVSVVTL